MSAPCSATLERRANERPPRVRTACCPQLCEIDKALVKLGDQVSAAERLYSSPVPLVYTRHTARFLACWLLLLPFALVGGGSTNGTPADAAVLEQLAIIPESSFIAVSQLLKLHFKFYFSERK